MWLILFFWVLRVCLTPGCSAQVQIDQDCPTYVSEGGTMQCTCVYAAPNPPPDLSISWPGYSLSDLIKIENVGRALNGTEYTCVVTANETTTRVVYTLQIAYGPDNVTINGTQPITTSGTDPVILTCLATEVNPTPEFTWTGITCINSNQGYGKDTCTFTPTTADEGKVVTCTAWNPLASAIGQTASGNFTLSVNNDATMGGSGSPLLPAVGGVVGAAVVVVVVIAVVVVVRRKGRTKGIVETPEFNSATPDSPDDGYDVPVSRATPGANETAEDHYDRLQQSDIGLRSLYSAISQPCVADRPTLPTIPVSSSGRTSSTGEYIEIIAGEPSSDAEVTRAPYDSLQMSDVNVPSVYSAMNHSTNKFA